VHPKIFMEFERICAERNPSGKVLEIGAIPHDMSLLCMNSLKNATEKVGLNLDGPYNFRDFSIVKGNANAMNCFEDDSFDVVLCNAMLEHDKYFWKTISEIHRLIKNGGLIVIGVPTFIRYGIEKIMSRLAKVPVIRKFSSQRYLHALFSTTITYQVHSFPGDYYRFSEQAVKEVLFQGCKEVKTNTIMLPPRIIGSGIKT